MVRENVPQCMHRYLSNKVPADIIDTPRPQMEMLGVYRVLPRILHGILHHHLASASWSRISFSSAIF